MNTLTELVSHYLQSCSFIQSYTKSVSHPLLALFWSFFSLFEPYRMSEFLLASNQNWSWVTLYLSSIFIIDWLFSLLNSSLLAPCSVHTLCLTSLGHLQSLPPTWQASTPLCHAMPVLLLFASKSSTVVACFKRLCNVAYVYSQHYDKSFLTALLHHYELSLNNDQYYEVKVAIWFWHKVCVNVFFQLKCWKKRYSE